MFADTYEYVRTLKESEDVSVLLVRHRQLGELRIFKRLKKRAGASQQNTDEAEILKRLHHPGIPVLYDCGEDAEGICLIEEYVRGRSLAEYLAAFGSITADQLDWIVRQTAGILMYLHSHPQGAVLYLDLKPEHIILSGDKLFLIDFGIARISARSGIVSQKYSTAAYAAPEIRKTGCGSVQSDLYSLGAMTRELSENCTGPLRLRQKNAIKAALRIHPKLRPNSVGQWLSYWSGDRSSRKKETRKKTVAVVGDLAGSARTEAAVNLCSALNAYGAKAYYEESGGGTKAENLRRNLSCVREEGGVIYHGNFAARLLYKEGIVSQEPPDGIRILEIEGEQEQKEQIENADVIVYVIGADPWMRIHAPKEWIRSPQTEVMVCPGNQALGISLAKELGRRVYGYSRSYSLEGSKKTRRILREIGRRQGLI